MKLFMDILYFIVISYFIYTFIKVIVKMKQTAILPKTREDTLIIRKHPERLLDLPTYSDQKTGLILYFVMLLFVIIMFVLAVIFQLFSWSVYLLLFLPMANSHQYLNLFAITEDGILSGSRFIPWKKIKSYQFVLIDSHHRYYGYSKEANDGYELKIKTTLFSTSCVITSIEMREKINSILKNYLNGQNKKTSLENAE